MQVVAIVAVFLLGSISFSWSHPNIPAYPYIHNPTFPFPVIGYKIDKRVVRAADEQYKFGYFVDNNIQGNFIAHNEQKSDDKVTGYYSYDNGNILRTVYYEADKKGFRVLKDESAPSKKVGNLDGTVNVAGYFGDKTYGYNFKEAPRVQRSGVWPRG